MQATAAMSALVPELTPLEAKLAVAYAIAAADGIHLPEEFDAINRLLGHRFAAGEESLEEQRAAHRRVTGVLEGAGLDAVLGAVRRSLKTRDDRVEALTLALIVARADADLDPREAEAFERVAGALDATAEEVEAAWYQVAE